MGKIARKLLKWLLAHGQDELHKEIDRRLDARQNVVKGRSPDGPPPTYQPPASF